MRSENSPFYEATSKKFQLFQREFIWKNVLVLYHGFATLYSLLKIVIIYTYM